METNINKCNFSEIVSPKVILPAPILRVIPGYPIECKATGASTMYTAVIWNSTILVNTTNTPTIKLFKEGNYTCVATNKYGTDARTFSVIFTGNNICIDNK